MQQVKGTTSVVNTVKSKDGTKIAYERRGQGPALILVDGALCYRSFGPMGHLSELLSPHFSVINYDRRGRGESGDTLPYSVDREIEDIEALIEEVGGKAFVFGTSSGGCLALEAAIKLGNKIKKLAMYEPPYNNDPAARNGLKEYGKQLGEALAANRRGDAVVLFMKVVGSPDEAIQGMRQAPMWPLFESVAPTLAYDNATLGEDGAVPTNRASKVEIPTLVLNGTVIPFMRGSAETLAKAIPHGQHRTLEGQSHDVNLEVLTPILFEWFSA
ncbi:MAG TPA: alpha/beta hydrolase [Aggregatilineales bacterium]|nr:alpha/beta hydrolase [Aggregatilineales bacterium]